MGCGESFVKLILFVINLLFSLLGAGLITLGIVTQLKVKTVLAVTDGFLQVSPYVTIAVGSVIFIIAFSGCWGAVTENSCLLTTYFVFMVLLIIGKVALAVLIFVNRPQIAEQLKTGLKQLQDRENSTFTILGEAMGCCNATTCITSEGYQVCYMEIETLFKNYSMGIGLTLCLAAALELVAAVFALCLRNNADHKGRRSY